MQSDTIILNAVKTLVAAGVPNDLRRLIVHELGNVYDYDFDEGLADFNVSSEERCCAALAWYQSRAEESDLTECKVSTNQTVWVEDEKYLVLANRELNAVCMNAVKKALWSLDLDFLVEATGIPKLVFQKVHTSAYYDLIDGSIGFVSFVGQVVRKYGRGPFLATDHVEHEYQTPSGQIWFLYRVD